MGEKDDALDDKTVEQPDVVERPDDADDDKFADLDSEEGERPSRLYRFARKLMDRKELAEDTRDIFFAALATSDKAKTEMVKMVAREVRHYLDELRISEDLLELARNHSLEVNASFRLKPVADALAKDADIEDETKDE
jgi:hypothetical protein